MVDIWMIFGMVVPFCEILIFVLREPLLTGKDDNGIERENTGILPFSFSVVHSTMRTSARAVKAKSRYLSIKVI